jgi:hypothetical protein
MDLGEEVEIINSNFASTTPAPLEYNAKWLKLSGSTPPPPRRGNVRCHFIKLIDLFTQ